jgi:outer membrane protein TolC
LQRQVVGHDLAPDADVAAPVADHDITSARYDAGGVSLRTLLDAERQQLSALEETRAVSDRYANSAALFQALGGGW